MIAEKKTLPFWRRRRPSFLALGRALASEKARTESRTDTEHAVIAQQIAQHRFEVSKGRVHPPT